MKNNKLKEKNKKANKFLFWTPRVLSIILIIFLTLFSLDIFGNGYSFWEIVLGLFMHNIPSVILIIILIISWKKEIVGAFAFLSGGLAYIGIIINNTINSGFELYYLIWVFQISGPAFLIGILFWINWKKKNK
jgi:hypothetical protein